MGIRVIMGEIKVQLGGSTLKYQGGKSKLNIFRVWIDRESKKNLIEIVTSFGNLLWMFLINQLIDEWEKQSLKWN